MSGEADGIKEFGGKSVCGGREKLEVKGKAEGASLSWFSNQEFRGFDDWLEKFPNHSES